MNDDRLRARLRAADPALTRPATPVTPELLEATMSTDLNPPNTDGRSMRTTGRRWPAVAAAAAFVLAAGAGSYAVWGPEDATPSADPTSTLALRMPGSGGATMGSCIRFDVAFLADMPLAFSGTATSVADDSVTLRVDHWYKGGSADVVTVGRYDPQTVAIEGGVEFVEGGRYLVTATDGTVNLCGFSGRWSADLADAFAQAFGA